MLGMGPDVSDSWPGVTSRPIVIVDYDPRWPAMFEEEKRRLEGVIGPFGVLIEHMGSTAVPGLAGKPVIDLLIGIPLLADAALCIPRIEALGYDYVPEFEVEMPYRRFFRKDTGGIRSHQIHMVEPTHAFFGRHQRFRDYLRAHPDVAREYAALKRELAARLSPDVEAYASAKGPFVMAVEARM